MVNLSNPFKATLRQLFAGYSSIILLLAGCATGYQSSGLGGGFSETQLSENAFRVNFRGNGYTGLEQSSDYALLRGAELALEHGYTYFIVLDAKDSEKVSSYSDPVTTSHTTGSAYSFANSAYGQATTTTYGGGAHTIHRPRSTITIVCYTEKPKSNGLVYEANFIFNSITKKYGIEREAPAIKQLQQP